MSRIGTIVLALTLGLLLAASPSWAKDKKEKAIPDITGIWKGVSDSVAMGKLGHTDATDAPKFLHVEWTLTIDKQEGRAFHGTKTSARAKETVVGVVDGAKLYMADDDGVYVGKLTSKNRLILQYLEAGKDSKVASITSYAREGAQDDTREQTPNAPQAQ